MVEIVSMSSVFRCNYNILFLNVNAEIMNLRNLERVLAREEEVKKRAVVQKMVYSGPQVRYYSKDGKFYCLS